MTPDAGSTGALTPAARSVLVKLPAPRALSVMEEMLRAASDNNNNNNNNNDSNGGSGCAAREGLNREELLRRIGSSMSDDQLHWVLQQQGII